MLGTKGRTERLLVVTKGDGDGDGDGDDDDDDETVTSNPTTNPDGAEYGGELRRSRDGDGDRADDRGLKG